MYAIFFGSYAHLWYWGLTKIFLHADNHYIQLFEVNISRILHPPPFFAQFAV